MAAERSRKRILSYRDFRSRMNEGVWAFGTRGIIFVVLIMAILSMVAKYAVNILGGGVNYNINYFYIEFVYLGIIAVFLLYSRHKIKDMKTYRQEWKQTLLFAYIGLVFYALKVFMKNFVNTLFLNSSIYIIVLVEYAFAILAMTSFALAVFNLAAVRRFYREMTISIVISFCFFSFAMFLRSFWGYFASFVGNAVVVLLKATFTDPAVSFEGVTLTVNGFSASIGSPCSGIESMAMFTSIFLLLVLYDLKDIRKHKIIPFFISGLAGMYLMTIIRIYTLYIVGTFNADLAMSLFHTNLGWVLFVLYMLGFLYFIYPKLLVAKIEKVTV